MAKALVKITYRQTINALSASAFEKEIFNASYEGFLIKSRAYDLDGKFRTFTAMKENDARANSLHYKLGGVVQPLINNLKKAIPDFKDSMGEAVYFEQAEFKLNESDVDDRAAHQLFIYYTTPSLVLHEIIGEYLLLSKDPDKLLMNSPVETYMLRLDPKTTGISNYYELTHINLPGRINIGEFN